jgi:ADP-ribose pyrophosphatase YjhB (NUDIX family)
MAGTLGQKLFRFLYRLYRIYLWIARPLTMGVRILLMREGQVLLIRQTYMDGWFMPGGGIRKGETLDQAVRREAREEVQAEIANLELLGVFSSFQEFKNDHTALFASDDFTLGGGHDSEVAEVRFFQVDALPADLGPGYRLRIAEYARALRGERPRAPLKRFGEW